MKNNGIKIGVVFILLFALLSVAGCQQEDVVIVGVEPGQPGPTSGQLRISFAPVSSSASIKFCMCERRIRVDHYARQHGRSIGIRIRNGEGHIC